MQSIIGKWRIAEMELWDKDFIDLIEPGCIEFQKNGLGSVNFGAIFAGIDYQLSTSDQSQVVEFSFSGEEEGNPICGRAKLKLQNQELTGKIFIHCGDESTLIAKPFK